LEFLETEKPKSGEKNKKVTLHHLLFISFLRNSIEKTRTGRENRERQTQRERERAREKQRRRTKAKGRTLNLTARKRS
jgi:hypothetical protein